MKEAIKKPAKIWIKFGILAFVLIMTLPVYTQVSGWLWKIDGKEYSAGEFRKDYRAFIELMAWQMGVSTDVLQSYLGRGDEIADEKIRKLIEQLGAANFAESYLTITKLYRSARETGYLDRPENRKRSEFISEYIMAQMYISDLVAEMPVEIPEEEMEKAWVAERKTNPALQSMTIDQGMVLLKQKMIRERREEMKAGFIKKLDEKFKIEKNPDMALILKTIRLD